MKEASKPTVYLAGDPKSGWQSKVCRAIQDLQLLDPSRHDLADPSELARWGLEAIRESDVVLAYLEEEDRNGHALAFELGYAKALGKTILLVREHGTGEEDKYFQTVREVADFCFDSLGEAVSYLVLSFLFEQNAGEKNKG
jgi:nucleoside 2-deoxyribosyltransferase